MADFQKKRGGAEERPWRADIHDLDTAEAGALGAAPLLGIELAQPASDVISLLIAIPVGLSELKKMADA